MCIEIEVQLNTPGSTDGAYRAWVNDSLIIERTGVDLRGATSEVFQEAVIEGDPIGGATSQSRSRYCDNLVISTSRVGPARLIVFE
jgi:hypothetical protein